MENISLNGKWDLYFFEQGSKDINSPEALNSLESISATVPGNAELDLTECGLLPKDIFKGMNITLLKKYENYEWWYQKHFIVPEKHEGKKIILRFCGVDCLAEYWLNGTKIGESHNMFIPHEFDVSDTLLIGTENTLTVRLRSVMNEAFSTETPMFSLTRGWSSSYYESARIRKAAHSYGWDIMPRALTNGIWRDVELSVQGDYEFNQLYCYCEYFSESYTKLRICYDLSMPFSVEGCTIEAEGICGTSTFFVKEKMYFKAGLFRANIENPKLWWPYGYGDPNLYEITVRVVKDGTIVAEKKFNYGIRKVVLEKTDTTDGINGCFRFLINDVPVMCKGSNWVPMDAFHSRDSQRYEKALELVSDIGCNILRCWGGNVYEDDYFYDYCDKNGIMVWQDFAMACLPYPPDDEFLNEIKHEAECIVKKLRNHASIILWSGDNECDMVIFGVQSDPNGNKITREVLPAVIYSNDINRPYLESSPYIAPAIVKQGNDNFAPEKHLWGPRDYYKSNFYTNPTVHFVSETGYHGCPSVESIKKFIDEDFLWPIENNEQWILHSSDQKGNNARIRLMSSQIKQLFGFVPETLEEFSVASQFSQAEAKKFFIENIRLNRDTKSGVIWWNLLDGWPQMSDAVVDYYYDKKLAYDFIKRSQQPFTIMCGDFFYSKIPVVASNDTLNTVSGTYKVTNLENDGEILSGSFTVPKNSNSVIGEIPLYYSDKGIFLIEWFIDGKRFINHYLYGMPAFNIEDYKRWFNKIK